MTNGKFRVWGAERGISTHGDVLVNKTADGVDLNEIFEDTAKVLEIYNAHRRSIADLFSFRTTNSADAVPQSISSDSFEEATEVGIPRAMRPPSDVLLLGYSRKDYDARIAFSWRFLRDADSRQVQAHVTQILESDNKLTTGTVLNRLFSPVQRQNEWGNTVYGLWSADGQTPPPYLGKKFTSDHSHYLTTASTTLDSTHVEALLNHVTEHGYGVNVGTKLVILLNDDDFVSSGFSSWRAGVQYRAGGPLPKYDFIPSSIMPAWISEETVHGPVPDPEFNGLQVWGSYANALVIKDRFIPPGYFAALATSGPNDVTNPIGFREHPDADYQGLRLIPGSGPYPLIDHYYQRTFGVGVRHRSAAAVAQITTGSVYTPPIIPT